MTVYMNFMYGIIYYKLLNHLKILNKNYLYINSETNINIFSMNFSIISS